MSRSTFDIQTKNDALVLRDHLLKGQKFDTVYLFSHADLSGIQLPGIRSLEIRENVRGEVNISAFREIDFLQILEFHRNLSITGGEDCKFLKSLYCNKYNPSSSDLTMLSQFESLQELRIDRTNILSLSGLERMPSLKKVNISNVRNLKDLGSIIKFGSLANRPVGGIVLNNGKHIDWDSLIGLKETCPNIEYLVFDNLNAIPNISFIEYMPNLKRFSVEGTNVMDGNMEPGDNLEMFFFDNKRHYNRKCKE